MIERAMTMAKTEPMKLHVDILVFDGCMLSSIATATDGLRVAQTLSELRGQPKQFSTRLVGARGADRVETSTGIALAGIESGETEADLLLIPGVIHRGGHDLVERLPRLAPEIEYIRRAAVRGVPIASVCSGTFLAAEAGVLDGRRATTSWWLAALMQKRYPHVALEADAMFVEDGHAMTSGAATSIHTLVGQLVAKVGGEALAAQVGRMFVMDPDRQSQAPYVTHALVERPRHSLSERAEHFLQKELHRDLSVSALAAQVGTSERSLLRHFRAHYGVTPLAHIQHLRVERAKALLETTHLSFDEIVERCGYVDVSSFRKLFKRATTLTPAAYRERFRLRAP